MREEGVGVGGCSSMNGCLQLRCNKGLFDLKCTETASDIWIFTAVETLCRILC